MSSPKTLRVTGQELYFKLLSLHADNQLAEDYFCSSSDSQSSDRLASYHLYGKWLFTWLSLVMSLMASYFMLSFFEGMSWLRSGTELSRFLRIFLHCLKQKRQRSF